MTEKIILIRNTNPENYGGAESYQLSLAKQLVKNNYEPLIISSSKKLIEEARAQSVQCMEAPFIKNQNWSGLKNLLFPIYCIKILKLKRWYKKVFKENNPHAVNIQSRDDWLAATLAAKKMNIKIFWTDHIDFRTWVFQNVKKPYKNFIGKWILACTKYVDKIIMISDYERLNFEKIYKEKSKIITIKNGVEDESEKYKKITPKKNSFCYIGRLVDYKGINELLQAFKNIQDKYPDVTLNIYGEDKNNYQQKAKDVKNVFFKGFTREPLKAIAENDFFILPSYYEGLSISLLSAAMMGKAIIVTNIDGNPEVVHNEGGILIPPKDEKAIEVAIDGFIKNPSSAKKVAKNARRNYEQEFNFEKTIKEKFIPLLKD